MAASSSTAKFPDGLDEETLDQTDLDKKLALALAESLKRKKRTLPSPVKHEELRSTKKRTLPSPPELLHVKREDQPEQPETIEIPMPPPSDSDTEESPVQEKDKGGKEKDKGEEIGEGTCNPWISPSCGVLRDSYTQGRRAQFIAFQVRSSMVKVQK